MSSLVKTQKQKSEKLDLIKYEINKTNVITNESLEDLDAVRIHEMKNLEEINLKIVMLERTKNNLEWFETNVKETELKENIEIDWRRWKIRLLIMSI